MSFGSTSAAIACCGRSIFCSLTILPCSKKLGFFAFCYQETLTGWLLIKNYNWIWVQILAFKAVVLKDEQSFSFKLLCLINWQLKYLFSCSSFFFLRFEALFRAFLQILAFLLVLRFWSEVYCCFSSVSFCLTCYMFLTVWGNEQRIGGEQRTGRESPHRAAEAPAGPAKCSTRKQQCDGIIAPELGNKKLMYTFKLLFQTSFFPLISGWDSKSSWGFS